MTTPPVASGAVRAPRVLIVPPSYYAADRVVGGGERYAQEYARALSLLTPTTLALFDVQPGRRVEGELEIRTFGVRHFRERWGAPLTLEAVGSLGEFDVIHSMVFPTPVTDLLLLSARLRRQTVVLTDVGGGGPCWSTYLSRLHPRADLNRTADGLALLSRYASRFFSDWNQPRTVLYGGAYLPPMEETRGAEGYALFVGRLLPHKGVLELIEAVSSEVELRVVGRPYDPDYHRRLVDAARGKRVRFILDANDAELRRQYAGASVVLQPSLPVGETETDTSELLGLVTIEAMAYARPVIVTNTASLPELVEHGSTGFVVEPNDRSQLRARIDELVSDPGLSEGMGRAARAHVEEHFSWNRAARAGLDFYRRLRPEGWERRARRLPLGRRGIPAEL